MRGRIVGCVVLLLILSGAVEGRAENNWRERRVGQTRGDAVDLGTSTLGHLEAAAGPLHLSLGLFDRAQVQSYLPLWAVGLVVPGSVIANGFAKVRLFRRGRWSMAVRSGVVYGRLNDLDSDGLRARAWVWPTRLTFGADWTRSFATSFELTGVYTAVSARARPENTDTVVSGVALARTLHAGVIPRYRLARWLTLFVRGRALLGHFPVVARAESQLSETTRIEIEAQTDAAQLSSGFAGVGGVHLHWPFLSFSVAGGYGTWFLPVVELPVGHNVPIAEFDLYFRF